METSRSDRLVLWIVLSLTTVFVAANSIHSFLQTDFWILEAWRFTPLWYLALWACITAIAAVAVWKCHDRVTSALGTSRAQVALFVGLVIAIAIFHYDSFVFGDGNLRIAQIAQSDSIFISPWEYGSISVVAGFFKVLTLFGLKANSAGVWGWRLYSLGCAAVGIWGAIAFARACTFEPARRVLVASVVIFTGPFLMYCGYVGVEPVIIPVVTWFSLAAYRLSEKFTIGRLVLVWLTVALGIGMTIVLAFLVPAALCVTIASIVRTRWNWLVGAVCGMAGLLIAFGILYYRAEHSVAISRYLVMPNGKLPLTTYTLTSWANISDKALTVIATAPIAIAILVLVFRRLQSSSDRVFAATMILAVIGGRAPQVAIDPTAGIVLDFPRLTAYLAPIAVAFAFYLVRRTADGMITGRTMLLAGTLCVFLPLATVPAFTKISLVDPLARSFAERHDFFYRTTGLAFRDAYFYNRDLDKANAWEQSLPTKSPDFLYMRGCDDLVANSQNSDALVSLYRLVARQPYWSEPRALLASLQIKLGHPQSAKPHVDTCLLLDPVAKQHLINEYRYFQAIRQYDSALIKAERAKTIHFKDKDIATDVMVIALQIGDINKADSLAGAFLAADTTSAYAHLVKGSLAERKQMIDSAVAEYRRFLRYAPSGNPDIDLIGKRLADLRKLQNPATGN